MCLTLTSGNSKRSQQRLQIKEVSDVGKHESNDEYVHFFGKDRSDIHVLTITIQINDVSGSSS